MADHSPPPRTRSVRLTLLGLIVVPLVSLAALWAYVATITISNVVSDQHYNTVTSRTGADISVLSADLVAERAATLAWLGSDRESGSARTQLEAVRRDTDKYAPLVRSEFQADLDVVSEAGRKDYEAYLYQLAGLSKIRAAVDSGADSQTTAYQAYAAILSAQYRPFLVAVSTSDATVGLMSQAAIAETRGADYSAGALALIQGALAAHGTMPQAERMLFAEVVGQQNLEVNVGYGLATTPAMTSVMDKIFGTPAFRQLQDIEQQVEASQPGKSIPVNASAIPPLLANIKTADQASGQQLGIVLSAASANLRDSLQAQLYLAGGLGLAAVLVSVLVMVRFGRSIERELRDLYNSAREMADKRLPQLVHRLRRGDDVDPGAESPPLRTGRITEVADVAQAFSTVQRTAVEAAVGQAALRKGVNQVFVSLSLRNQSLVHRQLSVLDEMERRASDPDALADLFRLDHLTTRMRRHAEGLLVLAGSAPGRGWRDPVPVADVIQAAAAEVEDYVRVTVITDSVDAVAGTAVSDVIHLLAELIENATQFSPPDTRVEVRGMVVGRGFAVEIEDRGLGMEPLMLAQVNQRLTDPPEFDLASTDQLGLFVAGRLAQRHGIRIALRPSAYGGTTAVVVLPNDIIVSPNQPGTGTGPSLAVQPAMASADGTYRELGPVGRRSAGAPLAPGGRHRGPSSRTPAQGSLPDFPEPPPQPRPTPTPPGAPEVPVQRTALPAAPTGQGEAADSPSVSTHKGMPRRIRQASMAPQLRRQDGNGQAGAAPEAAASPASSPEQLGSRLSSLQAGWLRGRLDDLELPGPDLPGGPTYNPGSGAGQP